MPSEMLATSSAAGAPGMCTSSMCGSAKTVPMGEGATEDKPGNRTGHQQVPGQGHDKVARNVDEPHHRQHLQIGKRAAGHMEQALAGAVERHDG